MLAFFQTQASFYDSIILWFFPEVQGTSIFSTVWKSYFPSKWNIKTYYIWGGGGGQDLLIKSRDRDIWNILRLVLSWHSLQQEQKRHDTDFFAMSAHSLLLTAQGLRVTGRKGTVSLVNLSPQLPPMLGTWRNQQITRHH